VSVLTAAAVGTMVRMPVMPVAIPTIVVITVVIVPMAIGVVPAMVPITLIVVPAIVAMVQTRMRVSIQTTVQLAVLLRPAFMLVAVPVPLLFPVPVRVAIVHVVTVTVPVAMGMPVPGLLLVIKTANRIHDDVGDGRADKELRELALSVVGACGRGQQQSRGHAQPGEPAPRCRFGWSKLESRHTDSLCYRMGLPCRPPPERQMNRNCPIAERLL